MKNAKNAIKKPISKRVALRFPVEGHPLRYKTEFEDGTGVIENISAAGCAIAELTLSLSPGEKVLLVISLEPEEDTVEIGGRVVRVEQRYVAVQFVELSEENGRRLVRYFAGKRRSADGMGNDGQFEKQP